MFKKILSYILKSVYTESDKGGKVSSTRISSYVILTAIYLCVISFICIDIINAINVWTNSETPSTYTIPFEHIAFIGMVLAHHLTLLGINKNSEKNIAKSVNDRIKNLKDANKEE